MDDGEYSNAPYNHNFDPLLYVDATVTLQPRIGTFAVSQMELVPTIETQTFTVPANDTLNEAEMRGLYGQDGTLVQYRLFDPDGGQAIPDGVRITVDQGGEESPRFNIKNRRGFFNADTPALGDQAQQTELYQYEDTDLFFNVENTTASQVEFSLTYTGYVYDLVEIDTPPGETDETVPVERLTLR